MNQSKQRIKLILWSATGIQTNALYLIFTLALVYSSKTEVRPQSVLEIFLPLLVLSLCLSILTMMKGFNEDKKLEWGLLWLGIFNIPSIIGFIISLTMMF